MPFYYDISAEFTSNGTTQTVSNHFAAITGATVPAGIVGIYGNARHGTAGGGVVTLGRDSAAPTGGGGATETKKHIDNPTATLVLTTGPTITSVTNQITVGIAQTGGQGGWVALERDMALQLKAAGGANGNAVASSKMVGTSVPINISLDWFETT